MIVLGAQKKYNCISIRKEGSDMAVELEDLYAQIKPQYDIELHTNGCFRRMIDWIHMVEEVSFVSLLHGDELVFNSGLHYTSEEWLVQFIKELDNVHAGGLIIALEEGHMFASETVDYCNSIRFPLFSATMTSPFIDIMRMFSAILLRNEQRDTNLITALKNAVFYPENAELYANHLERNGFFRNMSYLVVMLSCHAYDTEQGNERLIELHKSLNHEIKSGIVYEEKGLLVILLAGYEQKRVKEKMQAFSRKDHNIYIGIGSQEEDMQHIYKSYQNAYTAYQLTKTAINKNFLVYEELGVYKLLADVKEKEIYPAFVQETLGALISYDRDNKTEYTEVLRAFFENECSILNTSRALYCHKNTLAYKINKVKDLLGYDILSNENRTRIMLAFYIMKMQEN